MTGFCSGEIVRRYDLPLQRLAEEDRHASPDGEIVRSHCRWRAAVVTPLDGHLKLDGGVVGEHFVHRLIGHLGAEVPVAGGGKTRPRSATGGPGGSTRGFPLATGAVSRHSRGRAARRTGAVLGRAVLDAGESGHLSATPLVLMT